MTPREQDAKIAEWMGWQRYGDVLVPPAGDERLSWAAKWDENGLPDYLSSFSTDLNAMAEAEAVVKERRLRDTYTNHLGKIVETECPGPFLFALATAPAAQRAEALCKVIDGEQMTPPDVI